MLIVAAPLNQMGQMGLSRRIDRSGVQRFLIYLILRPFGHKMICIATVLWITQWLLKDFVMANLDFYPLA